MARPFFWCVALRSPSQSCGYLRATLPLKLRFGSGVSSPLLMPICLPRHRNSSDGCDVHLLFRGGFPFEDRCRDYQSCKISCQEVVTPPALANLLSLLLGVVHTSPQEGLLLSVSYICVQQKLANQDWATKWQLSKVALCKIVTNNLIWTSRCG